ncbi:MAG: universal stress protein [Planctomycetota bacterium]|nr:MAG: universal stress protein [Planctomycetota bacterium]
MTPTTGLVTHATVLMPFDGSLQAIWTFPIARTIAHVMDASLHLVLPGGQRDARARLALLDDPESEATTHELIGNLAVELVRLASVNPDAFIVAPAYGSARPESGLDPFPEEILRLSRCPVLVVHPHRPRTTWKPARILIPQDGTAAAAKALCPAARLAARSGAEVLIVHVSSTRPPDPQEPGTLEFPAYMDQPQHEWPSWAACFLERVRHLCELPPQTTLRFHWACGDPGREIVSLARRKKVDLIMVSWGRSPDPARSQVVRQILRESSCPILVLPCEPC